MALKKNKSKTATRRNQDQQRKRPLGPDKQPFLAHVYELRTRLMYIALSVGLFGGIATVYQKQLTAILLKPAGDQQFIFTSPGGGFDFVFRLCIAAGVLGSIPIIVYNLLKYIAPVAKRNTSGFLMKVCFWSCVLAIIGVSFGYFIAMPSGLKFLLTGFSTSKQIEALINIQSYFSFVLVYLVGSAILFQLPLLLVTINKIHTLKPKKLISKQRWVIVLSFVAGAIISPTPDLRNMLILSVPIIFMYNFGVFLVWLSNRKHHRSRKVVRLLEADNQTREKRVQEFREAQKLWPTAAGTPPTTVAVPASTNARTGQSNASPTKIPAATAALKPAAPVQRALSAPAAVVAIPAKPAHPVSAATPLLKTATFRRPSERYMLGSIPRERFRGFTPSY